MAMGRRKDRARTPGLWIAAHELPSTSGHPFDERLNQVLDAHAFEAVDGANDAQLPTGAEERGSPSAEPRANEPRTGASGPPKRRRTRSVEPIRPLTTSIVTGRTVYLVATTRLRCDTRARMSPASLHDRFRKVG